MTGVPDPDGAAEYLLAWKRRLDRLRQPSERLVETVDSGVAELIADAGRPTAYTLLLDGAPQSHVDLADPAHLEFEYVRRMAAAIDVVAARGRAIRTLHLGGGALTLPRYLAATRPGSAQLVVEVDGKLVELVRHRLPLKAEDQVQVRVADARAALAGLPEAAYDLVVLDVFAGARTPAHLTSVEFAREVARVLTPPGWLIANIADGPPTAAGPPASSSTAPLRYARGQVATIRAALPAACLLTSAAVLAGRRFGNLIALAGRTPPPVAELSARIAADLFPGQVVTDLDSFTGDATPVTDREAIASPPAPDLLP
ncbi:spermidine synthase [Paractinoplanes rishiriensis]|uniref:Methyltransferase type 11 domain-containing protein n=1 Tax=Paractinoplanes rishiriensis TaxID=1050105 RepID=A0A919K9N4_9ACTN|nr:fused MFS/spermidine synthase [Actinoplanes rishiriensis]GIF01029.1 hypothetical protein Ari01nite_84930 [Actinoplanes rishiriensis]